MKNLYSIILMFVLGAVLCGCSRDTLHELSSLEDNSIELNLGITTRISTEEQLAAGALGSAEYSIASIRVLVFDDISALDATYYDSFETPVLNSLDITLELEKEYSKSIYVIVNEPTSLSDDLDAVSYASDLDNLSFDVADALNDLTIFVAGDETSLFSNAKFNLPMIGFKAINAMQSSSLQIGVDRAVSRVDLMLDTSSSQSVELTTASKFKVRGRQMKSALLEPDILGEPTSVESFTTVAGAMTLPVEVGTTATAERALSFYVAERSYDADDEDNRIEIELEGITVDDKYVDLNSGTVVLGAGSELSAIERNYIYRIYATYDVQAKALELDNFKIVDWTEIVIESELEGVMVVVDNIVSLDWFRNGNTYTADNAGFGSGKSIDVYLPVITGYDSYGYATYEFELYEFEKGAGKSYDLHNLPGLESDKNYLNELDWLTDATLTFTSAMTGYVSFTYQIDVVPVAESMYPIRFRSDNVTKQMAAYYDNGYVPGEFLERDSEHWPDATNGIVFAMRGEAKHPQTEREDIYFPDDDGLYRGEYAMIATEADAYCKERLGEKWYAPNYNQMIDIQSHMNELGTSYRYQNDTDAYYWCSQYNTDSYWAISMEEFVVEAPVSRPSNEINFVRCVANL